MARIEIKDLEESIELDSQAMATVVGGKTQGQASMVSTQRKFDRLNPTWLTNLMTPEAFSYGRK
jgi:ribosomal protein S4E